MATVPDTHMLQTISATADVPAAFKKAFANFKLPSFEPAYA
jgi:hypothetical protein